MAVIVDPYHSSHVYTVNIDGSDIAVTVTDAASVVKRWLNTTLFIHRHYFRRNRLVVGLGVQWTPGGKDPPVDTLQLCIGRRCLIFQLGRADSVPWSLWKFLLNPDVTFVGFWNHSDRRKLESSEYGLEMWRDPLDLRLYAQYAQDGEDYEDLRRASVEKIVEKCLGFKVEQRREIARSYWDKKILSDDQIVYACVDAYCAFLMGKKIRAWKFTHQNDF